MDAVIILSIAIVLLFLKDNKEDVDVQLNQKVKLKVKLNENFIHDEDAFMEMAHELGFRNNDTV